MVIDLDSLTGHPGALGGDVGWAAPLPPVACRRLACDGSVTRVVVRRQHAEPCYGGDPWRFTGGPGGPQHQSSGSHAHDAPGLGLEGLVPVVMTRLPPLLGGGPGQPLDVGRSTRVVSPAQRSALAVRDGGCVFPGCRRPMGWCEAHHVWHWLDGGPTDLGNLALVCREHHRAMHDGGWHLARGPDGHFTATPPYRRTRAA